MPKYQATYRIGLKQSDELVDEIKEAVSSYPSFSDFVNAIWEENKKFHLAGISFDSSGKLVFPDELCSTDAKTSNSSGTSSEEIIELNEKIDSLHKDINEVIDIYSQLKEQPLEVIPTAVVQEMPLLESTTNIDETEIVVSDLGNVSDLDNLSDIQRSISHLQSAQDRFAEMFQKQNKSLALAFKDMKATIQNNNYISVVNEGTQPSVPTELSEKFYNELYMLKGEFSAFKQDLLLALMKAQQKEKPPIVIKPDSELTRNDLEHLANKETVREYTGDILAEIRDMRNRLVKRLDSIMEQQATEAQKKAIRPISLKPKNDQKTKKKIDVRPELISMRENKTKNNTDVQDNEKTSNMELDELSSFVDNLVSEVSNEPDEEFSSVSGHSIPAQAHIHEDIPTYDMVTKNIIDDDIETGLAMLMQ